MTTVGTAGGADPDTSGPPHPVLHAVTQLSGVAAATWSIPDPCAGEAVGEGQRVLLDLEPEADEAMVAHAVGGVLRERYGIEVAAEDAQLMYRCATIATREGHPEVDELRVVTGSATGTHALVALRAGDGVVVGRSQSAASEAGVARAIAEATLYAVEEMTEDGVVGCVEALVVPRLWGTGSDTGTGTGPAPEVEVALLIDVAGHERAVSGRAAVHSDVRQAIVRAVLAAVFDDVAG